MPSPYRAIFAAPGTKGFSAAGLIGRLPISMVGVGILTMISELTGRYAMASALTGTLALAAAFIGPLVSRLVDQYGQRRVLRPATLISTASVTGLVLAAANGLPDWTLFVFAAVAGCVPSVGSMVRARWTELYRDSPRELHTAYSFESVIDEVCFIFGPILAIGLSTTWFPEAGPVIAAGCLLVGVWLLTAQRSTEPAPHPRSPDADRTSALRSPGLQVLTATFVATGAIFGSIDVSTLAFAEEQGSKSSASFILAIWAAGSCIAGIVFGLLHLRGKAEHRWVLGICAMAVSMIPLLLAGNLPFLAVALFVSGLAIAPTMITTMALIEAHVPRAKLTEGMTWISTGLAVGVAVGSSVTGLVIDAAGAQRGFVVSISSGVAAAAVAFAGYRRLTRPAQGEEPASDGDVGDSSSSEERTGHVA
ncbi:MULTISPECIES: MFS transporter [Streptomyces]|uniref:MFS transporter n=1 Tax=Streptomyces TaxID=1883 RepID=UPI000F79D6D9|nr:MULTISPECIES: MFS transporter [Streptomyces]RST02640.1 MFS transporter [Streptomyces sp. WAC07149]GLX21412.1 MFS transporter [Streptomyces lavendulae subsp. lavendulae]GLX27930.1 MFS transporter [Streptomyces lavendulae subsp. lavendulae]